MFHFADQRLGRRLSLTLLAGFLFTCLCLGGSVAYALHCNVTDYLNRASASPHNPDDRYLFACGYVWHSTDGGSRWNRIDPRGLPLGVRDGYIAVAQQRDRLYLGILINTSSSLQCWDCAWKFLRPAIYTSIDGGRTWAFTYKFKRGPAANGGFLGLYVDAGQDNFVYTVIKNSDAITFYASGTSGQFWKPICLEYYDPGRTCSLPDSVIQFQAESSNAEGAVGK